MAKMCIICGEAAAGGEPVEDTQAIQIIRKIKKRLNMAANNDLVVCAAHLEEHKKRRQSFERKMLLHCAAGGLLLLLSAALPLFSSRPVEIASVIMIALLAAFLAGLAMLSYVPPLANAARGEKPPPPEKNPDWQPAHKPQGGGAAAHAQHGEGHSAKGRAKKAHGKKRG